MHTFYKIHEGGVFEQVEQTHDFTGYLIEWQSIGIPYIFMKIKDGLADGLCASYYNNGLLSGLVQFHKGERHGYLKRWYNKGQQYSESNYIHNQKHGNYRMWSENGDLILNVEYSFGKQLVD